MPDDRQMSMMPPAGPLVPTPQAPAGQTQQGGVIDLSMLAFLNSVDAPQTIKDELWGYMTSLTAFSKFDERHARASIYGMKVQLATFRMAVPFRRQTAQFEAQMNNILNTYKLLVYKATLPETERQLLAKQVQSVETTTNDKSGKGRGKFLGFL